MSTRYLTIHHPGYSCHVCGGVEIHNSLEDATKHLERSWRYDPEPNGIVVEFNEVTINRLENGEPELKTIKADKLLP